MKNTSVILKRSINIYLWMLSFLTWTFLLTGQPLAQNVPEVNSQPYKINGKEVKEYLIEKYKLRKDDIGDSTNMKQTPNGPKGSLSIMRNIKLKNVVTGRGQDQDRAMAKVFLEEEANLFGINNMDEIHERAIDTSRGHDGDYTTIYYNRSINNLVLSGVDIRITIRPDQTIAVSAELVPAPPELYEAVKKKTLAETDIRKIVEDDLKTEIQKIIGDPQYGNFDPKDIRTDIVRIRKGAISEPPYIIWGVAASVVRKVDGKIGTDKIGLGSWHFSIDAFTGEILAKRDSRIIN